MNKPFSIAVWSLGNHATKNTLPALSAADCLALKGVYTRDAGVLVKQSEKYRIQAFGSPAEMLGDPDLDAIYIAGPVGVHYEQVKAALLANKHVIVEKSSFMTLAQAEEMLELAQAADLVLMEAFMYRFHDQFIKLKQMVESEAYGRIRRIIASFGFPHLPASDIRYRAHLGGGALLDAGAYTISAINQLMRGEARVVYGRQSADDGFEVDTRGLAIMQGLADETGIAAWYFGADYKNEIEVWCEHAVLMARRIFSKPGDLETSIEVYRNGVLDSTIMCQPMNHFAAMFAYFAWCLTDQTSKNAEYNTIKQQMRLCSAIRNSCE